MLPPVTVRSDRRRCGVYLTTNNIHGARLETALAHHRSWTSHDFETALRSVADEIT